MQKKLDLRKELSYLYIRGDGIEIGPTFFSVPLKKGVKVTYVDIMTTADLIKLYPEVKKNNPVKVDVVDDGERLTKFENESADFIIANHFIEHAVNPIQTMVNFLRVLRTNGIIFLGVPDMRVTFDKDRPLTDPNHLVKVFKRGNDPFVRDHYYECVRLIEKRPEVEVESRVQELINAKFSIHYHTYVLASFLELIKYMRKRNFPIEIVTTRDLQEESDEFVVILRKTDPLKRSLVDFVRAKLGV
jgi:SAM-dependent methyltransferase